MDRKWERKEMAPALCAPSKLALLAVLVFGAKITACAINTASVALALADDNSWRGTMAEDLRIEEVSSSGDRGFRTFKLSAGTSVACLKAVAPNWLDMDRGDQHESNLVLRLVGLSRALGSRGLTPRLLAYKLGDQAGEESFIVIEWQEGMTLESCRAQTILPLFAENMGATLAGVHSVDTHWFDEFRGQLLSELPLEGVPAASPAWCYFVRGGQWIDWMLNKGEGDETLAALVRVWADSGEWGPQHPAARRLVTCHGDFNARNILRGVDGRIYVIDLDCACVSPAVFDIAHGFDVCTRLYNNSSKHALECKRSFISGYLGQPVRDADYEALTLDTELFRLVFWQWDVHGLSPEALLDRVNLCQVFASRVRASKELQLKVSAEGLWTSLSLAIAEQQIRDRVQGPWYYAVEAASWGAGAVILKALANGETALALVEQELQLLEADHDDQRQVFSWQGHQLLHASSGLVVARAIAVLTPNHTSDIPVLDMASSVQGFFKLGAPSSATEAHVSPNDASAHTRAFDGTEQCQKQTQEQHPHRSFSHHRRRQSLARWRYKLQNH